MAELLHSYLMCGLMSLVPVVELRGAIPVGAAMGLQPIPLLLVCVLGNMIPVPLIILFIRRLLSWMKRRGGFLARVSRFVGDYARKKQSVYYKYELWGLFILVAIPLPGTGAWTGALIAAVLDIRLKAALPVILAGVFSAGVIMCILTYGVKTILS